jgi:hypothetical protein
MMMREFVYRLKITFNNRDKIDIKKMNCTSEFNGFHT